MTHDREPLKCGAVYPGEPHGQLTCLKPWGHEDDHTTCLGAHDHGDGDLEYEWTTWEEIDGGVDGEEVHPWAT